MKRSSSSKKVTKSVWHMSNVKALPKIGNTFSTWGPRAIWLINYVYGQWRCEPWVLCAKIWPPLLGLCRVAIVLCHSSRKLLYHEPMLFWCEQIMLYRLRSNISHCYSMLSFGDHIIWKKDPAKLRERKREIGRTYMVGLPIGSLRCALIGNDFHDDIVSFCNTRMLLLLLLLLLPHIT